MADFYVKSGSGVTQRANSTAYALGDRMVLARSDTSTNHLIAKRWVWECTTAGTSGAAVPAWSVSYTQDVSTVTDGTVVWTARKPGCSSGTTADWAFATIFLDYALAAGAAGDTFFVSQAHSESHTSGLALTFTIPGSITSPCKVLCVDDSAAPPIALATGGLIPTNGAGGNIAIVGYAYLYGLIFSAGTGTTASSLTLCSGDTNNQFYENCDLRSGSISTGGRIVLGSGSSSNEGWLKLKNCAYRFANTAQGFTQGQRRILIEGGSISPAGSAITTLFATLSGNGADICLSGLDTSACATALNICAGGATSVLNLLVRNSKLPASWSGSLFGAAPVHLGVRGELVNCDSDDTNYRHWIEDYAGSIKTETAFVRVGGGSDGTVPYSLRMVSGAGASFPVTRCTTPELVFWNDVEGSPVTVEVHVITSQVSAPNSAGLGLDILYLGTANFPLGVFGSTAPGVLDTPGALTTNTQPWTNGIDRQNSTAYTAGNIITVQGNIFVCPAGGGGTSAASEPAAYATAAGGDIIVDGTASFRAAHRLTLSFTFTPEKKGWVHLTPWLAAPNTTVFICPKPNVT